MGAPRLFVGEYVNGELVYRGAVEIGVGPTPMLYFAVHHLGTDGGIQITGSHNPGDENGFKMMRGKASFFGEDIQKLRALITTRVRA